MPVPHIVAVVRPENCVAQGVLARIGLGEMGIEPHYGFEVQLLRVDAKAYRGEATPFNVFD